MHVYIYMAWINQDFDRSWAPKICSGAVDPVDPVDLGQESVLHQRQRASPVH